VFTIERRSYAHRKSQQTRDRDLVRSCKEKGRCTPFSFFPRAELDRQKRLDTLFISVDSFDGNNDNKTDDDDDRAPRDMRPSETRTTAFRA
jgi:hypothetical protein